MTLELDRRRHAMLQEMGLGAWISAPAAAPVVVAPTQVAPGSGQRPGTEPLRPGPVPAPAPVASDLSTPVALVEAGATDWPALHRAVVQCQACGLCAGRRAPVLGAGGAGRQADWLVLGEPPDEEEERAGEPFAGTQGQLLDNMLRAIDLDRNGSGAGGAWLSKVVKCRPARPRNPEPAELQACQAFLRAEMELVRPRIILAMGRFAAQSLLSDSRPDVATAPLGKLRGQVYRYQGLPLVVTYAPDALLRTPADKAKAWADLCLARQSLAQA